MEELVKLLIAKGKNLSTMESCTGGAIANAITNIPDASKVFNFSAVTYSNEFKIKMGVDETLIKKHSVYSMEVAMDMAKKIAVYTNSCFGIGVTGKLKKVDENNLYGEDDVVFLAVFDHDNSSEFEDIIYGIKIRLKHDTREENKKQIINEFTKLMMKILCDEV